MSHYTYKIIRPGQDEPQVEIRADRGLSFDEIFTVNGWYKVYNDQDGLIDEIYMCGNSPHTALVLAGILTSIDRPNRYYCIVNGYHEYSSKEEVDRILKLKAFE